MLQHSLLQIFLLVLLFTSVHAKTDNYSTEDNNNNNNMVNVDLLIHFTKYVRSEDAADLISHMMQFCTSCRYHVRSKPRHMKGLFTDFVVVRTSTKESVRKWLSRYVDTVRSVTDDSPIRHRVVLQHIPHEEEKSSSSSSMERKLYQQQYQSIDPAQKLKINKFWDKARGGNVRVGIFDTGIARHHTHFAHGNIASCINFTDNPSCEDGHGHGTFVAGTIASSSDCVGLTPEAKLHIFKVFTDGQASFTSWFLDAFNHAMQSNLDVINFSIGGPDYMDRPFVDKVNEVTASGITVVSAIGNDGPMYGTLTNPADQMDVIAVGAINANLGLCTFSSRGMTLHELPTGYGRPKPDIVTYGELLRGSNSAGGCKLLSGTSVASPVAAGAVALLASIAKSIGKTINPGMMKQVVTEGATKLPGEVSIYEQGM
eukprot:PhF_6_TR10071/c0_g1_i2/m.15624/K08653/MBTPS1; membrane-bound transcription factor site-1 protease